MPVSKHRPKHRLRKLARNKMIADQKTSAKNAQRRYIMDLIKQEQQRGVFDDNQTINPLIEGPMIDSPIIEGPLI